jgi:hypothetical protein
VKNDGRQAHLHHQKITKMKKNILIYGLIAGIIVSVLMISSITFLGHGDGSVDLNTSLIIGYASMLIALSLVYVGIRNYRDKYNGGVITFGKSFRIGMMIVLVASTLYVVSWMITYYFFMPDFMEKYSAQMLAELRAGGASQAQIDKEAADMANFAKLYKNPFFNALMTYAEILPVGLIVTLISSLILKRKTTNDQHSYSAEKVA